VFEFNMATAELAKSGIGIRLQPQPARLLQLLLSKAGELVTRRAIQELLWSDGTTVDFEIGVNRCVRQLRAALLDDSGTPRYIKTVPRVGYCFIASIATATALASVDVDPRNSEQHPSIVVLPFSNLSNAPDDEYFSDGLTEEIINTLAQIPGLKVIARTSAFAFKGRNEDIRDIAGTLGVNTVLEGSVRRAGSRIRVTAQLIVAADGTHLSSKRYDREITDIFAVQDEISADIAEHLKLRLSLRKRPATNVAAYQAYLEGRYHWQKFTPERLTKAFDCFQQAIAIDPDYSPAYIGLAMYYIGMAIDYVASPRDVMPKAAAAARRALELDETAADAYAALGDAALMLDFDWATAAQHFRRAMELNLVSQLRIGYALWFLIPQGRPEEAVAECDRVNEYDPLLLGAGSSKATVLLLERNYEEAAELCLRALHLDPDYQMALQIITYARAFQRRFEEAQALAERLIRVRGRSYTALFALGTIHAMAGDRAAAHRVLEEIKGLPGGAGPCGSGRFRGWILCAPTLATPDCS
jgi:TolB-like protein/Tfp pilus assembly protein PilF